MSIMTKTLSSGAKIPILGYGLGTAWYSQPGSPLDRRLVEAIKTALNLGYHHLDGAEVYNNEAELGVAITESSVLRSDLFVVTKLWPSVNDPVGAFERSLKKLQTDYVDLYLLHCPFFSAETHGTTVAKVWAELETLHASGKARNIGVSNFNTSQLKTLLETAKVKPVTNQIELHPYCYDAELVDFCKKENIVLTAYGPLSPAIKFSGGPLDPVLKRIAEKYGKTPGQVLLRWGVQKGFVVVTTTSKESRMREYLDIAGWGLMAEEVEEIQRVGGTTHKRKFWPKEYGETGEKL